jgi:metal-responsive CopG/Arc/MetJ family transcriptional regulator
MESVTIKIDENLAKRLNQTMTSKGYSTKTEFIREAIRNKLEIDEQEKLIKEFMQFKGKSKTKTTNAENKITREKIAKQIAKEFRL